MADPLNTLGFVSWGLLGEAEGVGERIYILDLGIAAEIQELVALVDLQSLAIEVGIEDIAVSVDLEEDAVGVEIKGGS